jgi:dihydrofolate reductase
MTHRAMVSQTPPVTAEVRSNSHILGADLTSELERLKAQPGGDIVVFGSGGLVPALSAAGLIDRYTLLVFPLVLGRGKRMFADGITPSPLRLLGSETSTAGVVVLRYGRATGGGA